MRLALQITMFPERSRYAWLVGLGVGLFMVACGGAGVAPTTPSTTAPPPSIPVTPPLTATVTITAEGATPTEVVVAVGGRVTFLNNDVRPHDMYSDPHDHNVHSDCPEINAVGFLTSGQSRQTEVFAVARECGYHDHILPNFEPTNGRIVIR